VGKASQKLTQQAPSKPQHSPHAWTNPEYRARIQYPQQEDNSLPLDAKGNNRLQQIIGTFLFFARAVDNKMLVELGTMAAAQTHGTTNTMDAAITLLNYAATHPDAAATLRKTDMILYIHNDAPYLSEPKARSRVGGYFYLGNQVEPPDNHKPNGPIHVESRTMTNVMSAAMHNGQEGAHIRQILKEFANKHSPRE
jgi:hypothetical protein